MAKFSRVAGATSQKLSLFIQDSSVTTGAGKTGLAFNTASLTAYYFFPGAASVAISLVTQTVTGAYSSGGFVEVDSTNMPGIYRLDIPNTALASGNGNLVTVMLKGAANMAPCVFDIELTAVDNQDGVHFGITGIPNAAAGASGGLHINGSNAGAVTYTNGMTISNASGNALSLSSSGSNGIGLSIAANGSGAGMSVTGGATGAALALIGGGTSGAGITVNTTAGDGISITPTAGNGITCTANGTSKHGAVFTGGTAGTSDGFKVVAGTGGLDLRGSILDGVTVETGLNARQSLSMIAAACAGLVSGAGSTSVTIKGCNVNSTTRIAATVDSNGNRSALTLTIPA